ncbi:MAG: glycine zipper 2TM domain-containing protein [Dokdonella sp.]|nr:glycine zipper 2TM domain-containing protein [Dokdonella sp.]
MKTRVLIMSALTLTALSGTMVAQAERAPRTHLVCHDVRVKHIDSSDKHRVAGTAIGAVAGGLVGHQIGGGKGKTLATVGGAVAGGVVGNKVQKSHQNRHATYTMERRCHEERG